MSPFLHFVLPLSGVEVTQEVSLEALGYDAKQQVAGQVRRRSPPEHRVPTRPERSDVELAQACDLDVVGFSPTDLAARHDGLG